MNRIYNESNSETTRRMPDGFVDMVLTSPPYDDLRTYNGYEWDFECLAYELFRVVKDGGVVVWVVNDKTIDGDESGTSFRQALFFKKVGFKLWDTMIFAKSNPIPGDFGDRYRGVFEYMFCFSKGKPAVFNPIHEASKNPGKPFDQFRLEREGRNYYRGSEPIVANETRRAANIFYYSVGMNCGDFGAFKHPAVFPEQLAKDQILSWSNEGDLVFDPFMGSGTTAKAAHLLGRRWIGSEISSEYVALANERLAPHLAQPSLI